MARRGWEFPKKVREQAYNRAGIAEGDVHHRISVKECQRQGIPASIATSIINATAMTEEEHIEHHRTGREDRELLRKLKSLQPRLRGL